MEGAENEFSNGRLMIPCYEGYFDEMKRDGRVVTDWTTYGKAGLFKKAEAAVKELEKWFTRQGSGAEEACSLKRNFELEEDHVNGKEGFLELIKK
ncbi:hypothetical protein G4B88_011043, partial [Cannabis sativa]